MVYVTIIEFVIDYSCLTRRLAGAHGASRTREIRNCKRKIVQDSACEFENFGGSSSTSTANSDSVSSVNIVTHNADNLTVGDSITFRAFPNVCVLFCDGAARGNPGPGGAGAVLYFGDPSSRQLAFRAMRFLGPCVSNNTAEYQVLYNTNTFKAIY